MNKRMIFYVLGKLLLVLSALLVIPFMVSFYYKENISNDKMIIAYLIPIGVSLILGLLLTIIKPKKKDFFAREGFVIVGLSWVVMSLVGALPFYISGEISNYIDAFFETVSGFTTTGASILENVEAMSHSLLFWRSFTHWVGGMGVLVFILAIMPSDGRNIHILRAESPGPQVGKLVSKLNFTARILYLIYGIMTVVEMVLLILGGMPLFDAVVNSFATAGTGGFGIKADSVGGYNNYCQIVIGIFMLLFGINFNFFYLILIKRFKQAFKCEEVFWYLGIICLATISIFINLYLTVGGSLGIIFKDSFFQVSSIMTSTGFATVNFDLWPSFSKTILVVIMFIGACAGSTGGGLKVSRVIILIKNSFNHIKKLLHPNLITNVHFEGNTVDENTVRGVSNYFGIFMMILLFVTILISVDGFSFTTNFTAALSCLNNIGPGLEVVGPMGGYYGFSYFSKIVLSITMLIGRLEIFPMLILFSPKTWLNK